MMESGKRQAFFAAGLQHYGSAVLASNEFKQMLEEKLKSAMLAIPETSALRLAPDPLFKTFKSEASSVYLAVDGTLAQPARPRRGLTVVPGSLELSVSWESGLSRATVYACVHHIPYARLIVKPDGFSGGVYQDREGTYLTREISEAISFDTAVDEVLRYLAIAVERQ